MLIQCHVCGQSVSEDAKTCPHCGTQNFNPPLQLEIAFKCKLLNPNMICDRDFDVGQTVYYESVAASEVVSSITEYITGDISKTGGSYFRFGDNRKVCHGFNEYVQYDMRYIHEVDGNTVCSINKFKRDNPNAEVSSQGLILFVPQKRDFQSEICCIELASTTIRRPPFEYRTYMDAFETIDVECISGCSSEITIYPSTKSVSMEIEIVKTGNYREAPRFRRSGLFQDNAKRIKGEMIPVYRYAFRNIFVK